MSEGGLNISQEVKVDSGTGDGDPSAQGQRFLNVVEGAMFDNIQEAQLNIQAKWPIRTGRSFQAWVVLGPDPPLSYELRNDAAEKSKGVLKAYAGFVHRKGDPTILATDGTRPGGVIFEVTMATRRINASLAGDGPPETDPTFAINRRIVALVTRALAREEADGAAVATAAARAIQSTG